MPKANSLIKFPRKGRSEKRGYMEDAFFITLNQHFKPVFTVQNDRHLPTKNGRPYEPDFVISTEAGKNIFINIEIDEPYDGWMRIPTHCQGESELRDSFFTSRGWIVIRFTEKQVHQQRDRCCALIARVIYAIDQTFQSPLLRLPDPDSCEQWNSLQAKQWASIRERERYLGISDFGRRSAVITEYDIEESAGDEAVEKEVSPVKLPVSEKITGGYKGNLAVKNRNDRDSRISFDAATHRYFIDGNPDTISVTQLIDKFFPEFDSAYWASRKAFERGITPEEVLAEWDAKKLDAANRGTALHLDIENHYNNRPILQINPEFNQFKAFTERYHTMKPFRSEWRIFDEDLLIAGTIDMVYIKEDHSLYMFDWKRSEKIVWPDGRIKNDIFKFALGNLSHLGDNSFNKYCLQQNIYRAILEKRYEQKISSMNLLVMHEKLDRYHHVPVPIMDKEVSYIFACALARK